jgi:hypothetical protein
MAALALVGSLAMSPICCALVEGVESPNGKPGGSACSESAECASGLACQCLDAHGALASEPNCASRVCSALCCCEGGWLTRAYCTAPACPGFEHPVCRTHDGTTYLCEEQGDAAPPTGSPCAP